MPLNNLSSVSRTAYATALTLLLVSKLPAGASCFCYPLPPGHYLDACGTVFAAKYLGLYDDTALHDAYGSAPQVYPFQVRRYWLGLHPHTQRLSLTFVPECKPRGLRAGTEYLVYLRGPRETKSVSSVDLPTISFCDSLVELAGNGKNLAALDSAFGPAVVPIPAPGTRADSAGGDAPTSSTRPTEAPPGYPWQATAWVLAALSTVLLALLMRRKQDQPVP